MNDSLDTINNSDSIILTDKKRLINKKTSQKIQVNKNETRPIEAKVTVSYQDIRNLVSTLYLKSLPGLEDIVGDYDQLIDEFYEPVRLTD